MLETFDIKVLQTQAEQPGVVRAQVLATGGFVGDCGLHPCNACGVRGDVLSDGKLVTCWRQPTKTVDTGL